MQKYPLGKELKDQNHWYLYDNEDKGSVKKVKQLTLSYMNIHTRLHSL